MNKILAVVAAFLLTRLITISVALAAENPEYPTRDAGVFLKQKKSEKILFMMKSVGISDPDITALVNEIDGRSKDGYLMLYQEKISAGTLSLRYALEPKINAKQVELLYVPDHSHTEYSVRTNAAMVSYKLKF